ncbi:MAG: hypothetical protein RLZZ543_1376 [Bacteroidota bacterium]|jgi:hypothetical protein
MRSIFVVLLISLLSLWSCTAPDTVQLSSFQGQPDQGLFAAIPICYSLHPLALGDTLSAVREKVGVYCEALPLEEENYTQLEWKERSIENGKDSIVRCTFRNQRLVHFSSETYLHTLASEKKELGIQMETLHPCLSEVAPIQNISYVQLDESLYQAYQIIQSNNQFSGLRYEIGYTEDSLLLLRKAHS